MFNVRSTFRTLQDFHLAKHTKKHLETKRNFYYLTNKSTKRKVVISYYYRNFSQALRNNVSFFQTQFSESKKFQTLYYLGLRKYSQTCKDKGKDPEDGLLTCKNVKKKRLKESNYKEKSEKNEKDKSILCKRCFPKDNLSYYRTPFWKRWWNALFGGGGGGGSLENAQTKTGKLRNPCSCLPTGKGKPEQKESEEKKVYPKACLGPSSRHTGKTCEETDSNENEGKREQFQDGKLWKTGETTPGTDVSPQKTEIDCSSKVKEKQCTDKIKEDECIEEEVTETDKLEDCMENHRETFVKSLTDEPKLGTHAKWAATEPKPDSCKTKETAVANEQQHVSSLENISQKTTNFCRCLVDLCKGQVSPQEKPSSKSCKPLKRVKVKSTDCKKKAKTLAKLTCPPGKKVKKRKACRQVCEKKKVECEKSPKKEIKVKKKPCNTLEPTKLKHDDMKMPDRYTCGAGAIENRIKSRRKYKGEPVRFAYKNVCVNEEETNKNDKNKRKVQELD